MKQLPTISRPDLHGRQPAGSSRQQMSKAIEREAVLSLRYLRGSSQRQLAEEFGISHQRVSALIQRFNRRLLRGQVRLEVCSYPITDPFSVGKRQQKSGKRSSRQPKEE